LAPESKEGLLWETYRKLAADGWRLDAAGYSTAFRVKLKVRCRAVLGANHACHTKTAQERAWAGDCVSTVFWRRLTVSVLVRVQDGQTDADLEQALAQLPDLLTYSFNLGELVSALRVVGCVECSTRATSAGFHMCHIAVMDPGGDHDTACSLVNAAPSRSG